MEMTSPSGARLRCNSQPSWPLIPNKTIRIMIRSRSLASSHTYDRSLERASVTFALDVPAAHRARRLLFTYGGSGFNGIGSVHQLEPTALPCQGGSRKSLRQVCTQSDCLFNFLPGL